MSTTASKVKQVTKRSLGEAWSQHATALAAWVDKHLVNRRDAYGGYYQKDGSTRQTTKKVSDGHPELTLFKLTSHFKATNTDDVIGLHAIGRDQAGDCWSLWIGLDIDRHGDEGNEESNFNGVIALYELAVSIGFKPLLLESNGRGGYHLILVFSKAIRSELAFAFAQWMVRDWKAMGLEKKPEAFPKQPWLAPPGQTGEFGNYLRIPGRHPTRVFWTRVYRDGEWLEEHEAIKAITGTVGTSPDAIPSEVKPDESKVKREQQAGRAIGLTSKPPASPSKDGTIKPGDDFNARATWDSILTPHDWQLDHESDGYGQWTRPGKNGGTSATTNHNGNDTLYVFTDASDFVQGGSYSKFGAYTLLNHRGVWKDAVKALSAEGYGTFAAWIWNDQANDWEEGIHPDPCPTGKGTKVRLRKPGEDKPMPPLGNTAESPSDWGKHLAGSDEASDDVIDQWPTIDPAAFHGIAGEIVRMADPHTEADPVAVLVHLLVGFASAVGHYPYWVVGADRHYMVLFAALVGATATARKGSSWSVAQFFLKQLDEKWATDRTKDGISSGEGLIYHIRDRVTRTDKDGNEEVVDPGEPDKRMLLIESELGRTLKAMNRDSSTLSSVLRQAWDCKNRLSTLTKNSTNVASFPHVSLIGHITVEELTALLSASDTANGLGNRFLWVCARRSKELPRGGNFFDVDWSPIIERFRGSFDQSRGFCKMGRNSEADHVWDEIFGDLTGGRPGLLGKMLARAEPQVMRLACIYAMLDGSCLVRTEHLEAALALWEYTEASAQFIFGESLGDAKAEKLLKALKDEPKGLTRTRISREVFSCNMKADALAKLLQHLLSIGLIHRTTRDEGKPGPSAELWFAGQAFRSRK